MRTQLAEQVEKHLRLLSVVAAALYAALFTNLTLHKPFWFDEIFSASIASLPRIADVWSVILLRVELNPPLPFWIGWLIHHCIGSFPDLLRVPAALGFAVLSLCLYRFVAFRTRPVYGVLAALMPFLSWATTYMHEARGYGLELGFAGSALVLWQGIPEGRRRLLRCAGLAVSLGAAVSCHYYAAFLIGSLLVAERRRSRDAGKRPDWTVLGAICLGAWPLLVFRPLLKAAAAGAGSFWSGTPALDVLLECYSPALLGLVPLVAAATIRRHETPAPDESKRTIPACEMTLAALLTAMPLLVFAAGLFIHLGFWPKYVILVIPGLSILFSFAVYTAAPHPLHFANQLLRWGFAVVGVPVLLWQLMLWSVAPTAREQVSVPASFLAAEPSLPIVFADDLDLLQQYFYKTDVMRRAVTLLDLAAARQYTGYDTGSQSLLAGRRWWSFPALDYGSFVRTHQTFLLLRSTKHPDWILQRLLRDGAQVTVVAVQRDKGLFTTERQLLRVQLEQPAGARGR